MNERLLTPGDVARLLSVSPVTVRQWAAQGWLKASRTAGQHRRFRESDVLDFARQRGLTLAVPERETQRLLVVEDDPQLTAFVTAVLEDFADVVEVQTADNGFEAGRKVEAWRPDILLLDLMVPGIDGFTLCSQVVADPKTRDTRIIAMTGYYSTQNVRRILDAGAETCLAKPFSPQDLIAALRLEASEPARFGAED
jgi:excisionase family DNA binding protein